jgi:hypothetical protein
VLINDSAWELVALTSKVVGSMVPKAKLFVISKCFPATEFHHCLTSGVCNGHKGSDRVSWYCSFVQSRTTTHSIQ